MPLDTRMQNIADRVEAGERISFDDGVYLDEQADLLTLGHLANIIRPSGSPALSGHPNGYCGETNEEDACSHRHVSILAVVRGRARRRRRACPAGARALCSDG